jgi:hypothetical protein
MQYEEPFTINNPCNQKLTEDEYKHYMITHHEVAVYMSKMHLHINKLYMGMRNPTLKTLQFTPKGGGFKSSSV